MSLITRIRIHSAEGHRLVLWNWSLVREACRLSKATALYFIEKKYHRRNNFKKLFLHQIFNTILITFTIFRADITVIVKQCIRVYFARIIKEGNIKLSKKKNIKMVKKDGETFHRCNLYRKTYKGYVRRATKRNQRNT